MSSWKRVRINRLHGMLKQFFEYRQFHFQRLNDGEDHGEVRK